MLEIDLCAQHNNGGLGVDCWWQSNIRGFFPVGEAAATHGVYRPGGSALNAGQAGALRAALFIARQGKADIGWDDPAALHFLEKPLAELGALANNALNKNSNTVSHNLTAGILRLIDEAKKRMSKAGAAFRDGLAIREALEKTRELLDNFATIVASAAITSAAEQAAPGSELSAIFRLRYILFCQYMYISAMDDYIKTNGRSRGGALYHHAEGTKIHPALPDKFLPDDGQDNRIQEIVYQNGAIRCSYREPRPIPDGDDFFEKVWSAYRENGNVY
jgi:hypothetical protein